MTSAGYIRSAPMYLSTMKLISIDYKTATRITNTFAHTMLILDLHAGAVRAYHGAVIRVLMPGSIFPGL